jgi:hypothetical protein
MYRALLGMYRVWNVWGGTSFVNPAMDCDSEERKKHEIDGK